MAKGGGLSSEEFQSVPVKKLKNEIKIKKLMERAAINDLLQVSG